MSHTGGALPYQAGRMDKSCYPAKLPKDPSVYLKTFYTDTVSPHAAGVKFAIEFFGVDHIMFGDDYPCWSTEKALQVLDEVGLSQGGQGKGARTQRAPVLRPSRARRSEAEGAGVRVVRHPERRSGERHS